MPQRGTLIQPHEETVPFQTGEITQLVRALAAKPNHRSSIPRTHVIEQENQPVQLSSDRHKLAHMRT